MAKKILVFAIVLTLVLSMMVVPSHLASALTVRTVFDNRHTSATFGDSKICGDHVCAKGEKPRWTQATWGFQRINSTKIPVALHRKNYSITHDKRNFIVI
jgi:hypothetical protein